MTVVRLFERYLDFIVFLLNLFLVVHDDLDLSPGTIRLKQGGGDGGHNGLRSTAQHLGSKDFLRLRVGIGHPGHRDQRVGLCIRNASSR